MYTGGDKSSYYRHPCSECKVYKTRHTLAEQIQYIYWDTYAAYVVDSATIPLPYTQLPSFMHVPFALFIVGSHDKQRWGKKKCPLTLGSLSSHLQSLYCYM